MERQLLNQDDKVEFNVISDDTLPNPERLLGRRCSAGQQQLGRLPTKGVPIATSPAEVSQILAQSVFGLCSSTTKTEQVLHNLPA